MDGLGEHIRQTYQVSLDTAYARGVAALSQYLKDLLRGFRLARTWQNLENVYLSLKLVRHDWFSFPVVNLPVVPC